MFGRGSAIFFHTAGCVILLEISDIRLDVTNLLASATYFTSIGTVILSRKQTACRQCGLLIKQKKPQRLHMYTRQPATGDI
jgi:hypothetical protein